MKTTGLKTMVAVAAVSLILAGEALAGGGGGFRRAGGPRPGLQGGTPAAPQEQAPEPGRGPGGGAPGLRARGDGPRADAPQARGGLGGDYAFCPYCGAPCPRSGLGIGRGMMPRFQNRGNVPVPDFQGGAPGPRGQGFGRQGAMRQPAPVIENRRRSPWQGRTGESLPPQGRAPQKRGQRPGWQQGTDGGRSGPDALTPPEPSLEENQDDFWAPPRRQRSGRGRGPDMYPPDELDAPRAPEATAPETPEAP